MVSSAKISLGLAGLVLVAAVAYRELSPSRIAGKTGPHSHAHGPAVKDAKSGAKDEHGHNHSHGEEGEGFVKLTAAQLDAAGVETAPVASGILVKEIRVPGRIAPNADRQVKVVPKVAGTVARIFKHVGETVAENELLAVLESRELSEAKADYLAAWRAEELASSVLVREERLWKLKVTAEQDYLSARNAQQTAKIKVDQARAKLHTVGLAATEIEALRAGAHDGRLHTYEIRAPIVGRVTSRGLLLGQFAGTEKDVFTIADLSTVWVEMAIAPADLAFAKEGQEVRVQAETRQATGKVVALSPVIDPDTRSAKAIAEIDNADGQWKLGDYVSGQLISSRQEADLVVPRDAIQMIKGASAVFVSQSGGFKMRPVTTGRGDSQHVEVLSGLEFAETIAVRNTFILKAELGKAEAEHQH